jgi:hypothetical protein
MLRLPLVSFDSGSQSAAKDATAVGNLAGNPDIRDIQAARMELEDACAHADEIDEAFVQLMRTELRRKP